jgi:hypothetical integral membrane protein (TIGR02206 family)
MREIVEKYLDTYDPFILFGTSHIISIFLAITLSIFIPIFAKKKLSEHYQHIVGSLIGYIVMSSYIIWTVLEIIAGSFDLKLHLPIHLCRMANLLLPFVMVSRSYLIYEILYFWGLSGMLQAVITPDIAAGFPHFQFFRFWFAHHGMIIALIYATVVYGMRPSLKSVFKAMFALNIFLLVSIIANILLDANYFWICGKPINEIGEHVPSLLDYLGPWPWYILVAEFVALLHFLLAYTPFIFIKRGERLQ